MLTERAGFWRRTAAGWIDLSVVYGVSVILIAFFGLLSIRLSLEVTGVVVGGLYGALFLWAWSATPGKTLLRVRIQPDKADGTGLGTAILREAVSKWGLGVMLPVWCLRWLAGDYWIPTIFDLVAALLVQFVLLLYYLRARRAWYDHLARTEAIIDPHPDAARRRTALVAVAAAAALCGVIAAAESSHQGAMTPTLALYHDSRSTRPYVDFLRQPRAQPVDYIMGLFGRYDIVILCEREHPEFTQWETICRLVSDRRFIESVGHVFTEYGLRNTQPVLDHFMDTPGLNDEETAARAREVMRGISMWPDWCNTNIYQYLIKLYGLNQTLPANRRIQHHFADIELDWSRISSRSDFPIDSLRNRDKLMSDLIVDRFSAIRAAGPRKKCLVVMNYRHAFGPIRRRSGRLQANVGGYLFEAFPGITANVMLASSVPFLPFDTMQVLAPVQGGVWDAAFRESGNYPAGFDFAGSPFGADRFDLFPFDPSMKARYRYRDVFTGYVFDRPQEEQYVETGIPGLFDGFQETILERVRRLPGGRESEARGKLRLAGTTARKPTYLRRSQTLVACLFLAWMGVGLGIAGLAFLRCRPQGTRAG